MSDLVIQMRSAAAVIQVHYPTVAGLLYHAANALEEYIAYVEILKRK